jgi:hypothetical protein
MTALLVIRSSGWFANLGNFLHRSRFWGWKSSAFGFEVADDLVDYLAEFGIKPNRVVTVNPGDQVGALADVDLILRAPLNPFVVLITFLHFFSHSIARRTCFS